MPFDFLRKKGKDEPKAGKGGPNEAARTPTGKPVPFDGLTEEWRLVGRMYLETRLSDALNKRESLAISDVQWAPIDGSSPFSPVPGLKSVDPYDLIVVIAGEPAKSSMSATDKAAALGQKTPYDVTLEAPPLRIEGRVYLSAGMAPERLMERSSEMFVPVVGGVAYQGGRAVTDEGVDAILVNRFYLRGVTVSSGGRTDDDQPLSQPGRVAPPRPASSAQPASPPPALKAPAPLLPAPKAAPPWASRTRPDAGPASAPPAAPRTALPTEPKPRVVPDWPAADRKPEPQPKKAADVEWPAADRKPEQRSAPSSPSSPPSPPSPPEPDDPPVAKAEALPSPEPAPSAPELTADPVTESVREPVDRPQGTAPPVPAAPSAPPATQPIERAPEAIAEEPPRAEASAPPPASVATPTQPPASRRDAGSKGWPVPESGCRPKRGGLGPRN